MVREDSEVCRNLLKFVEVLNKNKKLRKEYEDLKLKLKSKSREKYGEVKGEFIEKVLKKDLFS